MFCRASFSVEDPFGTADFGQCFEESLLASIPSGAVIVFAFFRVLFLRRKNTLEKPLSKWHITANRIVSWISAVAAVVSVCLVLIDSDQSGSLLLASFLSFLASVVVGIVLYLEHTKLQRASTGLMIYWLLSVSVWVIRIRTRFYLGQSISLSAVFIIQMSLNAISFILENMTFVEDPETGKRASPTPLGSNVNVFSRVTYWYMQPLMVKGSKQELTLDDLWKPDRSQSSTAILEKFNNQWSKELAIAKSGKTPSLIRAILKAFYPLLLVGFCEYWISFACAFLQPVLLSSILTFIANPDAKTFVGYLIAVGMLLNALLNVLMGVQMWITSMAVGYQIRSALCSAIFRKSMKLSNSARQLTSTGQINNMMAADTARINWFAQSLYSPLGIPVQISIALYLLWQQLGVACFGGLGVIILAIPLEALIGKQMMNIVKLKQSRADIRIEAVNESMTSIKLLKLYGWDTVFHKRIMNARFDELKCIKSMGITNSVSSLLQSVTPMLVSLVSFAIYSAINTDQPLDARRIFVSLSLFGLLSEPIGQMGNLFTSGSGALVAFKRMQTFLLLEELDDSNVDRRESEDGNAILVKDGTFKWDSTANENTLQNINFSVPKGTLAAVIGRVGTGKSSLISALLGELHKVKGTVRVSGSMAYVSQQAWIENATIRDNILFGSEYEEVKYNSVLDACALRRDLTLLPASDLTEIGEKGVNLSGGQKARLALARAVYNDADIYILDDVLSAVDAHVDKWIFDKVLGPNGLLSSKTRVFVTHGVNHLSSCDKVILINDKTVEQQGSYKELMAQEDGAFKALIDEYARDVVMEHDKTAAEDDAMDNHDTEKNDTKKTNDDGKLMTKETAGKGLAKSSVFLDYIKCAGAGWVVLSFVLLLLSQGASVGTGVWLDIWSSGGSLNHPNTYYLGIYAGIVILASFLTLLTNLTMYIKVGQNAAKVIHSKMLEGVMRSPMSFFDTNPLGRITNRFVGDIEIVDESLVYTYVYFLQYVIQSITSVIVICSVTPYFLILILPLFGIYYYLQNYYLRSAQAVQRVSRLTNSPVYALANTTFTGISTVRAFGKSEAYLKKSYELQDNMQSSFLTMMGTNKWIQFRLECIGAFITFAAALFAVIEKNSISAGSAGLSLNYALQITQYLYHTMRMFGNFQNNGVSLERIFEYFNLPSEASLHTPVDDKVAGKWPHGGAVEFKDVKLRYRKDTPLVLNGVSFRVEVGEKVGIVGRTGAGKSSLSVALFRLSEVDDGVILVDGQDISKLGLSQLRSHLTIIPQEPVLFGASVRENIDPGHEHTDNEIWNALEASYMKSRFIGHEEGLEQKVSSGGDNLSVGERQLFCLARAILRKTKVLMLDEATAGIDLETDSKIQATIRREFADATVLTIAHRIQTIMDSDKILVMNAGTVEEMDSPSALLKNPESAFSKLAAAAGVKEN